MKVVRGGQAILALFQKLERPNVGITDVKDELYSWNGFECWFSYSEVIKGGHTDRKVISLACLYFFKVRKVS
jgi:hypothetical protein